MGEGSSTSLGCSVVEVKLFITRFPEKKELDNPLS